MEYLRQGYCQHQQVDFLFQKLMQTALVQSAIPFAWELALGVTGPGYNESIVAARLWSLAWRCGVGENIHAHRLSHTRHCGTVSQLPDMEVRFMREDIGD